MVILEYNPHNLDVISKIIKSNLTYDLLPKKWFTRNMMNPMFGHCHTASACLQRLFGTKNIRLYRALDDEGIWHWWVIDKENKLIDLTSEQYTSQGRNPPYAEGQKASMLGFEYRKRVLRLYDRVMTEYENRINNRPALWS